MTTSAPQGPAAGFETLDAFLDHLRRESRAQDRAWFRLREDGLYERVGRRPPGTPPPLFTRQELLDLFGFTE